MKYILALLVAVLVWFNPTSAEALDPDAPGCDELDPTLGLAGCGMTVEELHFQIQQASGTTIRYRVEPMCDEMQQQPVCINALRCTSPPDTFRYQVFRSQNLGATWTPIGSVCLDEDDTETLQVITEMRIITEFKRIEWPEADLVIQPPDGKTLVNFKTNFYTNTTMAKIQPVTIFGHTIDIEATPASYTWHFGDGSSSTGPDPGDKYPNLQVTHTYVEADVTVKPSVEITYSGRWRIDGGAWHDIDETLTVQGTPVDLEVLTATPHLIG